MAGDNKKGKENKIMQWHMQEGSRINHTVFLVYDDISMTIV